MTSQLEQLAKKFPHSVIHQVPIGGGKMGDYVAIGTTVEKILAVVGPFDWEIMQTKGDGPDRAIVIGRLTVIIDEVEVSVDGIGDGSDLLAAESQALKRAARYVGVGLHLWSGDDYRLDRALARHDDEVEA